MKRDKTTKAHKPARSHPATECLNGAAHKHHGERSTSSTPSTDLGIVGAVEDVEGRTELSEYVWAMEDGLVRNFRRLGNLLASLVPNMFRHPDGGLVVVESDRPRRITSAKELAALIADHIWITITKKGDYYGERITDGTLNIMLLAKKFLGNFSKLNGAITTAIALPDFSLSQPGFNAQGEIFYLGQAVTPAKHLSTINTFTEVVPWQTNADRTNAVAALLTVPLRHHFPGCKPFILLTASTSHAGKGTCMDFIRCNTTKAEFAYQDKDWPMIKDLHEQLLQRPEIGVICLDNVRTDSSGKARIIRTGFLESFITNSEIVLSSATSRSKPLRMANRFVIILNTNEGSLSIDLLNRALPIRLNPTGDLTERIAKVKERLGGDVKHEWLPAHLHEIESEMWGMIQRWIEAGKPLDKTVRHPMGPWAETVGGILMVNGFTDFLANYSSTRAAADPLREALGILAFHAGNKPRRAGDLARVAVTQGLAKMLLPGADATNDAACERKMGVTLKPFMGQTFTAFTATDKLTYRLKKESKRWENQPPHYRYTFEEVGREAIMDEPQGVVLEERSIKCIVPDDLKVFRPEEV